MIARIGLIGLAALYALLVMASAIDRRAVAAPDVRYPLHPFAVEALLPAAQQALADGHAAAGASLARRAVIANPAEPAATGLLGAALLAQGRIDEADRAFRVAARMGWRDSPTQTYWLERALAAGDRPAAALRLDALLRQQPERAGDPALTAPFDTADAGRAALLPALRQRPAWLADYVSRLDRIGPEQVAARAEAITALGPAGTVLGCKTVSPLAWRLIGDGNGRLARAVWRSHCPGATDETVADGDLRHAESSEAAPFTWQVLADPDLTVGLTPLPGHGQELTASNSGPSTKVVLRQLLVAAPGAYRLAWRSAPPQSGELPGTLQASITCAGGAPVEPPARYDPATGAWQADVTLSPGCRSYWLEFAAPPGTDGAKLAAVRMTPE